MKDPCYITIDGTGRFYTPITPPCADTDELARRGERLVFKHSRGESRLSVVPKDIIHAGWVMGVIVG